MSRFIVDAMLGTLAKWLRMLGFDVLFAKDLTDDEIAQLAGSEKRILITRDRELSGRCPGSIYLDTVDLDEQVRTVLETHPAKEEDILTRCLLCNTKLLEVEKAAAEGNVPEGVLEREKRFWHCPECDKIYWPATHWKNMMDRAQELLGPS